MVLKKIILLGLMASAAGCSQETIEGKISYDNQVYKENNQTYEVKLTKQENPGKKPARYNDFWKAEIKVKSGYIVLRDIRPFGDLDFIGFKDAESDSYVFSRDLECFKRFPDRYHELLEQDMDFYRQMYKKIIKDIQ